MRFSLRGLWDNIVRVYNILSVASISIFVVLISGFCLFAVTQVTDAIVALGNFGSFHHFLIFVLVGALWAFFIWYWARVFYFIEFEKRKDLKEYEKAIVKHTPRILGSLALLIIGVAFLVQSPEYHAEKSELNPILVIGLIYIALAILFSIFVNLRRKIFNLKPLGELHESLESQKKIVNVVSLPDTTKKILLCTTIVTGIILVLLTIWPIQLTMLLGDGVTVLILCLCIWLPILYWIRYFSLRLGFPVYLLLAILIIGFSFFNGNKNIRVFDTHSDPRINLSDYTAKWIDNTKKLDKGNNTEKLANNADTRIPMIIVLSEGGGIRAAYWSAQLLAQIQNKYDHFRNYLFGISGVSGGSFGATVFDGVLNYYDNTGKDWRIKSPNGKNAMQEKITGIIGKDYLSPTVACLFTREMIQLLVPFPIESFDRAKVFEETWEYQWGKNLEGDKAFSSSFLSLWDKNAVPELFINTTQVENGYPVVLSDIKLNAGQTSHEDKNITNDKLNFPRDFYDDILQNSERDVRLSTASLLSARFPFVSPAGTYGSASLVDGGYFDNTGANTAYQVLFSIENSTHKKEIKPIIVYLANGIDVPDETSSARTMIGQLSAPIETSFQIRDSNTKNNLQKLADYVKACDGEFIMYSLQEAEKQKAEKQKTEKQTADIPLGWALSENMQREIDSLVETIDLTKLGDDIKDQ